MTGKVVKGVPNPQVTVMPVSNPYAGSLFGAGVTPNGLAAFATLPNNESQYVLIYDVNGSPVTKMTESSSSIRGTMMGGTDGHFYQVVSDPCHLYSVNIDPKARTLDSTVIAESGSDCLPPGESYTTFALLPGTNDARPRVVYAEQESFFSDPNYLVKVFNPESNTTNTIGKFETDYFDYAIFWKTVVVGPTKNGFAVSYASPLNDTVYSTTYECNNDGSVCSGAQVSPGMTISGFAPVNDGYHQVYCNGNFVTPTSSCFVQAVIDGKPLTPTPIKIETGAYPMANGQLLFKSFPGGERTLLLAGPNANYLFDGKANIVAGPFNIPTETGGNLAWEDATLSATGEVEAVYDYDTNLFTRGIVKLEFDFESEEVERPEQQPKVFLSVVNPATVPTTIFGAAPKAAATALVTASIAAINSTSAESASAQNPSAGNYQLPSNSLLFLMAACGSLIVFLSVYAAYRLTRPAANAGNVCNDAEQQSLQEQQGLAESRRLSK